MVKSRRNFTLVLVMILVLSTSLILAACDSMGDGSNSDNSNAAFSVLFLQENELGQWVEYERVTSVNGIISEPANPTRADYKFVGWYKDKTFATPVDDVTTIKSSTALYAKFDKVNFQVKFMNGDVVLNTVKSAGKTVELPSNPEAPEGKVFVGWYTDAELNNAFENGTITSDLTVYAKFNDVNTTYQDRNVTLMVDGKQLGNVLVSHFGAITLPENPTKENWTFIGWYTDEAYENAFVNGTIENDTTLYAKFQQVNFTIKFMNGETEVSTVLSNKNKVEVPTIADKKGYEFKGWFLDSEFKTAFEPNNVTADATVYAKVVKLPGKNVTFMIPNGAEWVEYKVVESDSATDKIELPANPFVKYMTFKGWYKEKECKNKFAGTETITEEMTVYANCLSIEVTVHFDGNNKGTKNLSEIQDNFGEKVGEGQTVDGWYTDATYTIKWDGVTVPQNVYARTAVAVTFNNGYEDIYVGAVVDGKIGNPHDTIVKVDGKEQTVESLLTKDYMSDRDISYLDETGKPFDFNKTIDKATTITVRWNSKLNDSVYKKNPKTGNYYIETYSFPQAPVISLLSDVTIMLPESDAKDAPLVPTKIKVEAIYSYGSGLINENIKKIMIGEGFISIKGLTGEATCIVDTIELPSTLKIIDGCFNNMPKLTNVTIPDGVEVVLASFFKKSMQDYKTNYLGTPYDFDINVPASVKNMAHVPNNFVFAAGSTFSKEGGYIYQETEKGKVLISDPAAYSTFDDEGNAIADTIVVPEGVVGIQVGTYNVRFNYLKLPSTFKFVNYNVNASDYKAYVAMEGSSYSFSANMLFDEEALEAPSAIMSPQAYTIVTTLGGARVGMNPDWTAIFGYAGKVIFATETVPAGLNDFAFAGDSTGYAVMTGAYQGMTDATIKDNVILKNAFNEVYVTSTYNNLAMANVVFKGAAAIDPEAVKAEIISMFPADLQAEIALSKSIKFFVDNKEVVPGEVTSDMFITLVITPPAKLTINTNWKVGYTGSGYEADDYKNPAAATRYHEGEFSIVKLDTKGMTAETLKADIKSQALKAAMTDFYVENFAKEVGAKLCLDYFYNNATVKFQVNGKDVDPSTISLEDGSVTLDVVWTLA